MDKGSKNKFWRVLLIIFVSVFIAAGCSKKEKQSTSDGKKEEITLWFWGAEPYSRDALDKSLIKKYNDSQDKFVLKVEYRNSVDSDLNTALAANKGPDIVYGSGPSFVKPLVEAGKLESLDKYSKEYGWEDQMLAPIYDAGKVKDELYAVGSGLNTVGVFYNKKVLTENNWEIPKTVEELEKIMQEAEKKGLYPSVTGNKGWKPVNENYSSLFLTHFAGPQNVYEALKGEKKWDSPEIKKAVDKSAEWYKAGFLGGKDYANLNFSESLQLLADGKSPFFIGPTIGYQWATSFFTGDAEEDLGFMPFPKTKEVPEETYTVSLACTFSINKNAKDTHKDEGAKIINMILQPEFVEEISAEWPGYWGAPLKDLDSISTEKMGSLSTSFIETIKSMSTAIDSGNFGYMTNVFFPPATQQVFIDIENVWLDQETSTELLDKADKEFTKELEKGLVPNIPQPGSK